MTHLLMTFASRYPLSDYIWCYASNGMSQLGPPPPPSLSSFARTLSGSPNEGDERVTEDKDTIKHLEYYHDRQWLHDPKRCRTKINPICDLPSKD